MSKTKTTTTGHESMERVDPDEKLLATIYRHPFGIVSLYAQVLFGVVAASGLIMFLLPTFVDRTEQPQIYSMITVVGLIVAAFLVVVLLVATVIYNQSKLVITDKTITQILQEGLFNRRISQLSVSNIEDVTASRKGIFQSMLNYGTLFIETAGEQENFHFIYCPNPDHFAKVILEARQAYVDKRGSEHLGVNIPPLYPNSQPAPQQYQQSPQPPAPQYPQPSVPPQEQGQYPPQYQQPQPQPAPPYQQPYYPQPPAQPQPTPASETPQAPPQEQTQQPPLAPPPPPPPQYPQPSQ